MSITFYPNKEILAHVELGDDGKCPVARVDAILLHLESGNSLYFADLLFVPGLKNKVFSILVMKDKGFAVELKN
jgi:hypothetical protein